MSPVLIISEQVRQAIANSGASLREISRKTDLYHSQLSLFMRGERGLTLGTLDKLAEYLGLKLTKKKEADE